jgi:hypothetical protein
VLVLLLVVLLPCVILLRLLLLFCRSVAVKHPCLAHCYPCCRCYLASLLLLMLLLAVPTHLLRQPPAPTAAEGHLLTEVARF